jgi:hypothetical protein
LTRSSNRCIREIETDALRPLAGAQIQMIPTNEAAAADYNRGYLLIHCFFGDYAGLD